MVLLNDLLDDHDRSEMGFRASFMDMLSIVEQCLMMRSAYFYGDVSTTLLAENGGHWCLIKILIP